MVTETASDDSTRQTPTGSQVRSALFGGRAAKAMGMAGMLAGFFLALDQVDGLVLERQWMRDVATETVGGLWGPAQHVAGPFLIVPVDRVSGSHGEFRAETAYRVITPDELDIAVVLDAETRRRGLFEVPVYTATATLTGRFAPEAFAELADAGLRPPVLAIRSAAAAGIVGTPEATWNDRPAPVDPALSATAKAVLGSQAIAAPCTGCTTC